MLSSTNKKYLHYWFGFMQMPARFVCRRGIAHGVQLP